MAYCRITQSNVSRLMCIALFVLSANPARSDISTAIPANHEPNLRAAVVIGILRFASQYDHDGTEYPLCLMGSPPSGEKISDGAGVNINKNRKLTVHTLPAEATTADCAAIVAGPQLNTEQQARIEQEARQNSIILICDTCQDDALTHVTLRRKGERIVFAVDIGLAEHSHVTFSSKLLGLAVEVKR